MNFSLHKSQISFDANGNIRKGYNIIAWNWRGQSWAFDVVGAFTVNPDQLHIDQSKILWHTKDHQVQFCIQILFIVKPTTSPALLLEYFPRAEEMLRQMGGGGYRWLPTF